MSDWQLIAPVEVAPLIAQLFKAHGSCRILAQEDEAFREAWLPLGEIKVQSDYHCISENLITGGAFEWQLPSVDDTRSKLIELLGHEDLPEPPASVRVDQAMNGIASIGVRTGLTHPTFDPDSLEEMPFRSTTILVDTSAVLQGALDFVVRHLHPTPRVKVPAIVHMELVNSYDRFRGLRSGKKNKNPNSRTQELNEHLKSQGGQRVLIRLELGADTEIERTYLLGDPLRNAFQTDNDSIVSGLGLSKVTRAYADRLILEAARHHQAQTDPGHAVRLLTADQGLARMAMAEGVEPLFFTAVKSSQFFGERLSGQMLDPFTGDIFRTSLLTVIWELATAFGAVRLNADSERFVDVRALGKRVSWSPYHSKDDLLWYKQTGVLDADTAASSSSRASAKVPKKLPKVRPEKQADLLQRESSESVKRTRNSARVYYARFNVGRMFNLICALDDKQVMSGREIRGYLKGKGPRGGEEYLKFLVDSGLISSAHEGWTASSLVGEMAAALRNERVEEVKKLLAHSLSFAAFADRVANHGIGEPLDFSGMTRSRLTYRTLGEVTLLCALSHGKVYATPCDPDAESFARTAYVRFAELSAGEHLVATGAWLESLIRDDGIHPEVAKRRLEDASEAGFLRRYTEGSTTQARLADRIVHVLRSQSGMPVVQPIHLYRGDYLIPGKGSVSLRIEEAAL